MPAYKNQKKTRQYTNEFKARAVKLTHLSGASVKGVAESLDAKQGEKLVDKILFSTDQMPVGVEIKQIFPMIQVTGTVEISKKDFLRSVMENGRNEYQEVLDRLINAAPAKANAIIGVQVSTAAQAFNNGSFLYVTYIGTPAILGDV